MPNLAQAKKALRQSEKRRVLNDRRRRTMRESVKDLRDNLKTGDSLTEKLSRAYQALDKAAKQGVIKSGTASRRKSRLAASVKRVVLGSKK